MGEKRAAAVKQDSFFLHSVGTKFGKSPTYDTLYDVNPFIKFIEPVLFLRI